jgi:hypothetical protein
LELDLPEPELPLPDPELPEPEVPELPEPEVPELPEPEVPEVPELPEPDVPEVPELPEPDVPEVPELPEPDVPEVPELPEPEEPELPELPEPEIPGPELVLSSRELEDLPDPPLLEDRLNSTRSIVMRWSEPTRPLIWIRRFATKSLREPPTICTRSESASNSVPKLIPRLPEVWI